MLKQPVWIAAIFIYGGYVAFGGNSCERSDRAVMPIHWAGQGIGYVMDNFSTNKPTDTASPQIPIADGIAGWLRDFVLVDASGGGVCEPFNPTKSTPKVDPTAASTTSVPIAPNDGKPLFLKQGN